jgi:hypothetical protein
MCFKKLSCAESLRVTVLLRAALDDVENCGYVFLRSVYEAVLRKRVATWDSFAIDLLAAGNLYTERRV